MDTRVHIVINLMRENLQQKLPLWKMAQCAHLSTPHLRRLFKDETGMPPARYLKEMRMQEARQLLETSPLSVKEIALKTGMGDVSHFVRDFKRAYRLTPVQYRAQHHGSG